MASSTQGSDRLNAELLVDSIPALIHTSRPDGYLDYFNKPWLEYLGVTLDKVAGWNWIAYIHPEDVEGIVAKWRASLATGGIFDYETRVLRANGEYRWMFHRKVPLRDANGNIVKWYGSSLDIEERKTAEEARRSSEAYLAEAQKLSQTGSWANAATGEPRYWSEECYRVLGFDFADPLPSLETIFQRIHPDDRPAMREQLDRGIRDKADFEVDMRILHPLTGVRNIRSICHAVVDTRGDLREMVGTVIDITDHKRAEEAIRRSEAYLAEAQRLSNTGSFGWKVSSGEIFWSDQTFRIFEFPPSTKVSLQMILDHVHSQDLPSVQMALDSKEEGIDIEHRLVMPDGRIKYLHVVGKAQADESGSIEVIGAVMDITERKVAEQTVRRSEAYLAEAQRLTHTGSWVWNVADRSAIHLSEEWYRVYGFDPDQGAPPWEERLERVHSEDRLKWKNTLERAILDKADYDVDFRIVLPDGIVKWIHTVGHPVFSVDGDLLQFVGSSTDITERKTTEDKIRRLVEAGTLGIFFATVEGGIVEANQAFLQMLQYDRQDLVSGRLRWADLTPAEWRERDERSMAEFLATGVFQAYEKEYFRNDGSRVPVLVGGAQFQANEGVVFVLDLSEQKRAEQKIRERERELRQILDLAPQHIGVFGPDGSPLYANRATLEYLGVGIDRWRDETARDGLVHPDDRERFLGERKRRFLEGAPHEFEARLLGHDGKFRWFLFRLSPLKDEPGQITRWYGIGIDIEDRKQAEDRLRQENVALREEIDKTSMFEEIVGTSPALKSVLSRISKVAPSDSTVLITGETGTGKELVARAIHRRSDRASRPFVSVNCAAMPRDLIASELFGHEKGAFTGATQQRLGRFELANGGTIFLDEVGELPPETQIALLRVLQEHEFERVGGNRRIRTDVRVITATNRDLQAAISAGSFRSDLFYRLNVFPIEIPSLRERREDIPLLVEYFIDRYARKAGKKIKRVSKKTVELLLSYPWPGNIRELQNVIERSVILCETEIFSIDENWLPQPPLPTPESKQQVELPRRLLVQEKDMIESALKDTRGRVSGPTGAAARLGIPRSTLESKIRSLKINKNRYKN